MNKLTLNHFSVIPIKENIWVFYGDKPRQGKTFFASKLLNIQDVDIEVYDGNKYPLKINDKKKYIIIANDLKLVDSFIGHLFSIGYRDMYVFKDQ